MSSKPYLLVSGIVFGLVAIAHLTRVVSGWPFQLGPCEIPMWISWCGVVGPGILAFWAFRLVGRAR